jgi:alpha-N-arabinofuranosidase
MNKKLIAITSVAAVLSTASATEFHVAVEGSDDNSGTMKAPFHTIQHAADLAQPGDIITVHKGIYRERVSPPRGGTSDKKRITYQAASGEKVVITGAEPVKNWEHATNDTWKVTVPDSFFGRFNPYTDVIHGDWFDAKNRQHHTGAVYLNGDWLMEAAQSGEVFQPAAAAPLWFGEVTNGSTTIWAQFKGVNPNEQSVEINVRQTVFTPEKTGINYVTVRGFDMRDAATPWAPPSAGQFGVISAYWCKGWIIEDNEICYSKCCGVVLGKYSDEFDNTNGKGAADPYTECVRRALKNGWNKETVGSHIVRNNHVHHCEQSGIVGSLGCSFSTVTGNDIHDIHVRNLFGGAEMAGIKFHGAIDVVISGNHIYRCGPVAGIWLDWMAQGALVTGNFLHDNSSQDMFLEMQHGPILVANNLFLSRNRSVGLNSQGVAFAHNLILGPLAFARGDKRATPFQTAHATEIAGMYPAANGDSGDCRFYNNLFVAPAKLSAMDNVTLPCFAADNVFTEGTQPSKFDAEPLLLPDFDTGVRLEQKADGWYLTLAEDKSWRDAAKRKLVTTELLGKAKVPDCTYENGDGSPLILATDYFGKKRNRKNPFPGPFEETAAAGKQEIKVWPSKK